jgi:group I intron endonuclease
MKTYIIYRHTLNNKHYIGYTSQTLEERLEEHIKSSLVDKSERHFHRAIRKYGVGNLMSEVIDSATTKEEALQKERQYIIELDTFKNGYNMTLGGDGGNTLEKYTEEQMIEHRKLKSKNGTGMNNGNARPDVTVDVLIDTLIQFIVANDYHDRYILQRDILDELKRVHGVSIEAVRRRAKNVAGLMKLVIAKMIELELVPVKYDSYYRSEEERKQLAKMAGGYSWVTDGTTNKQVKKSDIDKYLAENTTFRKGRTL